MGHQLKHKGRQGAGEAPRQLFYVCLKVTPKVAARVLCLLP